MSYCVNCGVELHPTADTCALCGTMVVNPCQPVDADAPKPYATDAQLLPPNNKAYLAGLIAALLTLPVLVCLITNLVFGGGAWSVYPIGGIVLFWVLIAVPLLLPRPLPLVAIGADACAILVYLFLIATLADKGFTTGMHWYLGLALPIVLVASAVVLVPVAILRRRRLDGLRIASLLFTVLGFGVVGIETTVSIFVGTPFRLSWSWIVLASCLAMALALWIISRSSRLQEEIRRRLHV
jgi:hypothetical protein